MSRRATSHDVARLAGVSQSTVSFVFNGRAGISAATRERVLRAAAELRYRPNLAARSMRTHRTGRLAVVIPVSGLNLFPILEGAAMTAREAGYVVEVVSLPPEPDERATETAALVESGDYEGILSFSPMRSAATPAAGGGPVVVSLSEFDEQMHATGAFSDAAPVDEMVERLAGLGHRRFLHIAGPSDYPAAVARRDAYVAVIDRLGLESLGVVGENWDGPTARRCVEALPAAAAPLAIIAANDVLAAGAIGGAVARGWSVPGDVSVTGWDDLTMSALFIPALTTVFQDRRKLGVNSMERLLAAIRGEEPPVQETGLQHVVWRDSTGAPKGR